MCYSIIALRKAEKAEEQRAREKIRQKLEEDKVETPTCHETFYSSLLHLACLMELVNLLMSKTCLCQYV